MGGLALCEKHEVPADDLDSIQEVLERLWLHFETLHNDCFFGEVIGPIAVINIWLEIARNTHVTQFRCFNLN